VVSDQDRQGRISRDDAKRLLIEEAPAPMDVFMRDPGQLISRHPREAVALAAALGVLIAASPRIRQGVFAAMATVAKVFLR
jgi:hypothetical protein